VERARREKARLEAAGLIETALGDCEIARPRLIYRVHSGPGTGQVQGFTEVDYARLLTPRPSAVRRARRPSLGQSLSTPRQQGDDSPGTARDWLTYTSQVRFSCSEPLEAGMILLCRKRESIFNLHYGARSEVGIFRRLC
jgi:hypothetical protein